MTFDKAGDLFFVDAIGLYEFSGGGESKLDATLYYQALALTRPSTTVAVGATVTLTATVGSTSGGMPTGPVTFFDGTTSLGTASLSGSGPMTATLTTSTLAQGTHFVTAHYAASTSYLASISSAQTVIVGTASPTISFGIAPNVNAGTTGTVTATATSGLVVTFSTTSPTCSVTGAGVVTGISVGTCVITASQAGDGSHLAAVPATLNLSIGQGAQTITFGAAPTISIGGTGSVTATGGGSNNAVTFSTTSAACTVTPSGLVSGVTVGPCVITAAQAGNTSYLAATAAQSFNIGQASQSITFGAAPNVVVNGTGTVTAVGGASGNDVTFSTASTTCTVTATGTVTGINAGACLISAAQAGDVNYLAGAGAQTLTIGAASQHISFTLAPGIGVGETESLAATASSGLTATFSTSTSTICSVTLAGTLTGINAGSCVVSAAQAGNANYLAAPTVAQTVIIGQGIQAINFGVAPNVTVGHTGTMIATGGGSGNPVIFSTGSSTCSVSASGIVTGVNVGPCLISAVQAGNANYLDAPPPTQTLPIAQGSQTITFGAAPTVGIGVPGTVTATATSGQVQPVRSTRPER